MSLEGLFKRVTIVNWVLLAALIVIFLGYLVSHSPNIDWETLSQNAIQERASKISFPSLYQIFSSNNNTQVIEEFAQMPEKDENELYEGATIFQFSNCFINYYQYIIHSLPQNGLKNDTT